jgi:hypothetical protein
MVQGRRGAAMNKRRGGGAGANLAVLFASPARAQCFDDVK